LAEIFTILENFDAVFGKRGILFAITPSNRVINVLIKNLVIAGKLIDKTKWKVS
jgi:hypothetical protein